MAATLKPLASGQLTDSETTLYTCPSSTEAVVVSLVLTNTTDSEVEDVKITVTLSTDQRVLVDLDLGSGYQHSRDSKIMLSAGDTIEGQAGTASAIDYVIFGMEKS